MKLVYSGNLGRTYDLATVIRAVESNDDFELDVAGFGKLGYTSERVHFHGMLSADKLRELFSTCDIGVVPMEASSWVGIPNKLIDYAASGLGIVSSLGGESAALLGKYRCGATYRSGDVESFVTAVRAVAKLERGASRRLCEAEFDARQIYANYVKTIIERIRR